MKVKQSNKLLIIFLIIIIALNLSFGSNSVIATTISKVERNIKLQALLKEVEVNINTVHFDEYNLKNILEAIKEYTKIWIADSNGNKKIDKEIFQKLQRTKEASLDIWISPYCICCFKRRRYNKN